MDSNASISVPKLSRYVVQRCVSTFRRKIKKIEAVPSSDVISDMRINISENGSNKVLWYKVIIFLYQRSSGSLIVFVQERFLTDDEIVEHIVVYIFAPTLPRISH